jgi:hypothetical protein
MVPILISAQVGVALLGIVMTRRLTRSPVEKKVLQLWLMRLWIAVCAVEVCCSLLIARWYQKCQNRFLSNSMQLAMTTYSWFTNSSAVPFPTNSSGDIVIAGTNLVALLEILTGQDNVNNPAGKIYYLSPAKEFLDPSTLAAYAVVIDANKKGYCNLQIPQTIQSNLVVVRGGLNQAVTFGYPP